MKSKLCGFAVLLFVAVSSVGIYCNHAMNNYVMAQESPFTEKSRHVDPLVAAIRAGTAEETAAEQPAKYPKLTTRTYGKIQGNWVETKLATMAMIHKNDVVEKHDERSIPYVAVYVKDNDGKTTEWPYALVFSGGELTLQIPSKRAKGDVKFATMRRLEELIDAAEQLHNDAR